VYIIEKYIKRDKIKIIRNPPAIDIFGNLSIREGREFHYTNCKKQNYVAIIDDERARKIGFEHNIEVHRTLFLLKLLFLLKN